MPRKPKLKSTTFMGLGFDKDIDRRIRQQLERKMVSGKYIARNAFMKWLKEMEEEQKELEDA